MYKKNTLLPLSAYPCAYVCFCTVFVNTPGKMCDE